MIAKSPTNGMDNGRLHDLIKKIGKIVDGQPGYWRFSYQRRALVVVTDESQNRMRIMTPVVSVPDMSDQDIRTVLAANFGRALDLKQA